MSTFELRLPDIGEGIVEAELVTWLVRVGDHVRIDDPVAEVMTDKATVELPSPVDGTVAWLAVEEGHRIAVGAPVLRFEVEGSDDILDEPLMPAKSAVPGVTAREPARPVSSSHQHDPSDITLTQASSAASREVAPQAGTWPPVTPPLASSSTPQPNLVPRELATGPSGRALAAPAVRRRAAEMGVDIRLVKGSGPAGRIEHGDLDRFIDGASEAGSASAVVRSADTTVTDVSVSGLRRVIAQNMAEAASRIPHITYVEEVDVTELERLRQHLNDRRPDDRGKLTPLAFVVRALVTAISDYPEVNARFDDEVNVAHRFGGVHVGIATQTPRGLMVPVLRHAEARDISNSAEEIRRLSMAARNGTIEPSELSGSTITITSLGALGGVITTPIINRPEVAIIGVNKMEVRPVWQGNAFTPRTMMNLSSSFDHRIIDGWDAAVFIARLKELLELPALMFMERT